MNEHAQVIDDARLLIVDGRIRAIVPGQQALPVDASGAPEIDTGGTIYPGLIDLHNHYAYNVLRLWSVPDTYPNRGDWQRNLDYIGTVQMPPRVLVNREETAMAVALYVEAKAIAGGTTTGAGMRAGRGPTFVYRGNMRNVEQTDDPKILPAARSRVPDLWIPQHVEQFRLSLAAGTMFYHLSEGTDPDTRQLFFDLRDNNLISGSLAAIHALALTKEDLVQFHRGQARIVWSPLSNLLLYGATLRIEEVLGLEIPFAIGNDWTPSGSKNLLHELKVARWVSDMRHAGLDDAVLVRAVTAQAAHIVGWGNQLGTIERDRLADLVVLEGNTGDPYAALIAARERDIKLVVIDGVARYGEPALMDATIPAGAPSEQFGVDGETRTFAFEQNSPLAGLTLGQAVERLEDAMIDLIAFREETEHGKTELLAEGEQDRFKIVLDQQFIPGPYDAGDDVELLADPNLLAQTVELDPIHVDEDGYWPLLDKQKNLDPALVATLKRAYGR